MGSVCSAQDKESSTHSSFMASPPDAVLVSRRLGFSNLPCREGAWIPQERNASLLLGRRRPGLFEERAPGLLEKQDARMLDGGDARSSEKGDARDPKVGRYLISSRRMPEPFEEEILAILKKEVPLLSTMHLSRQSFWTV